MTLGVSPITQPPSKIPPPAMGPVKWGAPMGRGYPSGPPPETGLGELGLSDPTFHAFAAMLAALPPPSLAATMGTVSTLSLLHLRFA